MERNLCKYVLDRGGSIHPLVVSSALTGGLGLMNPSIYNDNGNLMVNIRSVNYTLYHSENEQRYNHRWGPLSYLNPENDVKLKTRNIICRLDENLDIITSSVVDTSLLDKEPVWEFHGLEDARLVKWNNKLYLCGVRRDVKPDGQGRMELSEIVFEGDNVKEISRVRIKDPHDDDKAYCNKNWMPVLNMPYHFVKWTNPTEIVIADPGNGNCKSLFTRGERLPYTFDFRGGSQVLDYNGERLTLIHETNVWQNRLGQKDARYPHRFVQWDEDWNIKHVSDEFSFMTAMIEFSCGMTFYNGDLLITFGFQDNAAYILRIPENLVESIIR